MKRFNYYLISKVILLLVLISFGELRAQDAVFPAGFGLNIKTDYGAKGDGVTDDTQAILTSLELNGGYKFIYFPNGTYLVSDQLISFNRDNNGPQWVGESRDGVIIKLKDGATGFGDPSNPKSVVRTATQSIGSADFFRRDIQNMTIDVGNNIGAIGMEFYSNNVGILQNVKIKGPANAVRGLNLDLHLNGPCLVRNVEVEGFKEGVRTGSLNSVTLENITLKNQSELGMRLGGRSFVRGVTSTNSVTAIRNVGNNPLVDVTLTGGASGNSGIINTSTLFARNISSSGYGKTIENQNGTGVDQNGYVTEWTSHGVKSAWSPSATTSLNLPIKEVPEVAWETDLSNWVNVRDYGATLGNNGDNGPAIQAAIDDAAVNNKTVVYFPDDIYRHFTNIRVHGSVKFLIGGAARIIAKSGARIIVENGSAPVVKFLRLYGHGKEGIQIENASSRKVIIESGGTYIFCTGNGSETYQLNGGGYVDVLDVGASFYGRQLNSENTDQPNNLNDGGTFWVLGLKTEKPATKLETRNGGKTEVIGAFIYQNKDFVPADPLFIVNNAEASFTAVNQYNFRNFHYDKLVEETRGTTTKTYTRADNGGTGFGLYTAYEGVPVAQGCNGTGTGLTGAYYDNISLSGTPVITRTDISIDFNWRKESPGAGLPKNYFSVRWTGQVEACFTETYTFETRTSDGVRLWVDNQLIIDKWIDQSTPTNWTGTIDLVANQKYDIKMEYYEDRNDAVAKLKWGSKSQERSIIQKTQLYPGPTVKNLTIANHSFENGDLTNWIAQGNNKNAVKTGDAGGSGPAAAQDGTHYVWGREAGCGGANPAGVSQFIDVSPYAVDIDGGSTRINMSAWGVGQGAGSDFAQMQIKFYNAVNGGGSVLSNTKSSNKAEAPNIWTEMRLASAIPAGTRSIEVFLFTQRGGGSCTDAGFDNVSASIEGASEPVITITENLSIANFGFENGDLTSWIVEGNNKNAVKTGDAGGSGPNAAEEGTYYVWGREAGCGGANPAGVSQFIDISTYAADIDAGNAKVNMSAWGVGEGTGKDFAQMQIKFFDAINGGGQIGGTQTSNKAEAPNVWTEMTISDVAIPSGTRSVEVFLFTQRGGGSCTDAGFDNVSGTINLSTTQRLATVTQSIKEIAKDEDPEQVIKLFPNPSNGIINILGVSKNATIKVFNTLGSPLLSVRKENVIDLSNQTRGLYFVHITDEGKTMKKMLIVK